MITFAGDADRMAAEVLGNQYFSPTVFRVEWLNWPPDRFGMQIGFSRIENSIIDPSWQGSRIHAMLFSSIFGALRMSILLFG
jgi:hypothetical protein